MRTTKLVYIFATRTTKELPPLSAGKVLSAISRQTIAGLIHIALVGAFRRSIGCDPAVDGRKRKCMLLPRWEVCDVVNTKLTIKRAVSSIVIRGNSTAEIGLKHMFMSKKICP